jgi:neutral ceramidase
MNAEFLAGVGVRGITPSREEVDNSLHAAMTVRTDELGSPLQAKALALGFAQETRLLVALDLCYLPSEAAQMAIDALAAVTGLPRDAIVVSCSHSHSTPMIEPLVGPHPLLDLVVRQSVAAAVEAMASRQPARIGRGQTHVVGASFNTRVPLAEDRVKFARDFREGLSSGRPIDPRLSVIRIDDHCGRPIAGWVRFAAHPANVIFNAPLSAEYPGYLTDRMSGLIDGCPPILFGYGASGDVNCIPMFGRESQSRDLGHRLADLAAETFLSIQTAAPTRFLSRTAGICLPLVEPPDMETLDREIEEVEMFMSALDRQPELVWVLGFNCGDHWPVEKKRGSAKPLADWARMTKARLLKGQRFPTTWTRRVTAWAIDDLGLVFDPGETFAEIGMAVSARSPLTETFLQSHCNGCDAYLATDAEWRRGGYEPWLSTRYAMWAEGVRPLPYALGAAGSYVDQTIALLEHIAGAAALQASMTSS